LQFQRDVRNFSREFRFVFILSLVLIPDSTCVACACFFISLCVKYLPIENYDLVTIGENITS